jgi:hypothetical protein
MSCRTAAATWDEEASEQAPGQNRFRRAYVYEYVDHDPRVATVTSVRTQATLRQQPSNPAAQLSVPYPTVWEAGGIPVAVGGMCIDPSGQYVASVVTSVTVTVTVPVPR